MRTLVTGGAGFIGSNLVKVLVDRGDDVTVIDDFSVGRVEHLADCLDDIEVVTGSVCDLDLMRELMSKTDTVFHLAVKCLVECNGNPVLAHEVNVGGTFNVCLAAHEANAKIVYVSSSEVYGTCMFVPMAENHPTEPQSIYGLSKLMGEEYVKFFNKYYGVPAVIIRPFNAYGPHHRIDQYSAVITAFIRRLENAEFPIIEGTGKQSRDFTYVSDIAEGIALLSKLEHGEVVNIGSGKATSIKELATTLLNIYELEKRFIYAEERPNDVFKLHADISLAKAHGYEPKVSLKEGLRKYISWWRK
jgi:UDP-glucose 4-epimerase